MKLIALAATLMLTACGGTTTILAPDGSLHTCQHYVDGVIWWDTDTTDGSFDNLCKYIGVDRAHGR